MSQSAFQIGVYDWLMACFGAEIACNKTERADRYLEETLELLQSVDYPVERIIALIGYVYGRPKGEPKQETGGVMVTLAAFCSFHDIDMDDAAQAELARVWTKIEAIRAKQAAKPTGSALPIAVEPPASAEARFTAYFVQNYPGPNTVIYDPKWHAPKIFRAALAAISAQEGGA